MTTKAMKEHMDKVAQLPCLTCGTEPVEIAAQAKHLGSKWTAEDWKRLLIDKFARDTNRTHGKVIPNLDSSGVVEVGILSRKFSKADGSEFIEWLHAWAAENGVELSQ